MIVLSSHLDDAVWSAASWLAENDAELVTICAGVPAKGMPVTQFDQRAGFPSGDVAVKARREEDKAAARLLGVAVRHMDVLDGGYGAVDGAIEQAVADVLADAGGRTVIGPLGLWHPDHLRVAEAFRNIVRERRLDAWCYEDLPYAYMRPEVVGPALLLARCDGQTVTRSAPAGKQAAVNAYGSQINEATHMTSILGPERFHRLTWHSPLIRALDAAIWSAADIPGWMSAAELLWLGEQAAHRRTIIEIGSFLGRSAKVMAAMTSGTVYCVDDMRGAPGVTVRRQEKQLRGNLAGELAAGKVHLVRKASLDAAPDFEDGFADMVFIDGDHGHPAAANDVRAWRRVLKPGGLLCGHDSTDPDVERSLKEVLPDYQLAVDNIWRAP